MLVMSGGGHVGLAAMFDAGHVWWWPCFMDQVSLLSVFLCGVCYCNKLIALPVCCHKCFSSHMTNNDMYGTVPSRKLTGILK